jgi:hypothetical protein
MSGRSARKHCKRYREVVVSKSDELKEINAEFYCVLIVRRAEIYSEKISRDLSSAEQVIVVQKERRPVA